jgi:hypothetical protein
MFGLSIVKTAELNNLKLRVADLEQDLDPALDQLRALQTNYDNLFDPVRRSDKATRNQLDILVKVKTCPVQQQTHKHETDPVGAWESKQRVLEQRLQSLSADAKLFESQEQAWRGVNNNLTYAYACLKRKAQEQVAQIKKDIYEHGTRKPIIVQKAPESETAVVVRHKKYNTLGLLKGHHITILSKGNQLDVGDVILNATPAVVYQFWDILPNLNRVSFHV